MREIKIKNNLAAKFFFLFLSFLLIFPFSAARAIKIPSAVDSMNQVMGDLGMDKNEVRNTTASFNVSRQKKQAPQVRLDFNPANPLDGQEVTVEASPMYIGNAAIESLYYTWLLKHDDGSGSGTYTDSAGRSYRTEDGNIDWNRDGNVDREDWKIEAARLIANGGFDWRDAQSRGDYVSDTDDDGYRAVFGGDDQRNKTDDPQCYVHDFINGNEYEIECDRHLFPDAPGETTGNDDFDADEELFWRTDPLNNDTVGSGHPDEANVAGLGQNTFRWMYRPGDKVTVAVEGISFEPTQESDSSYKVMWAMPKNKCDSLEEAVEDYENDTGGYTVGTTTDSDTQTTQVRACLTAPVDNSTLTLPVDNCSGGQLRLEDWLDANGYDSDEVGADWPTIVVRIPANPASDPPTSEEISGDGITVAANSITLSSRPNGTAHNDNDEVLGNTIEKETVTTTKVAEDGANNRLSIDVSRAVTLTITDQNGNELFTDSWNEYDPTEYHERSTSSNMEDVGDLNECLDSNLMSPSEGNPAEKIKVTLAATPDSPMNDPTGANSDYLSVDASLENASDPNFLQYDWAVYQSDDANTDDWGTQLTKAQLTESGQISGLGVKSLKFKLALNPTPAYLKVKLAVTEKSPNAEQRKGTGSIVIPLNSSSDKIFAYNTRIVPNPAGGTELFALDTEICRNNAAGNAREAERNAICPVLKNEVIGLRYTDQNNFPAGTQFLWTLNGKPITYENCFFEGCGDPASQAHISYFPVLGDVGTTYTIGLSIVPPTTQTRGQKINLIRTFQVQNPSTDIVSLDQYAQAVLLGNYIGLDGQEYPDYSQTDYQAVPTTTINLQANRYPFSFPLDSTKTMWFVDGEETGITGPNLSFRVDKPINNFYTVSFNTLYTQSLDKKRLMYTYWNVMPDQFYEIQISKSIDITMASGLPGVVVTDAEKSPKNKFLAAIFSGAPLYISFLFRIVLTTLLLLFGAWIIFSMFPASVSNENEYKE
jgi:hypothetical protein